MEFKQTFLTLRDEQMPKANTSTLIRILHSAGRIVLGTTVAVEGTVVWTPIWTDASSYH